MEIIRLEDIHFNYPEDIKVFEGLNFTLKQGDRIGIMGLNGSGKTTLFYLIMGLLKPKKGKLVIWGKERTVEEDFKEVRRKIGYLFQDPDDQLFSPTVEEDISFGPLNLRKSLQEVHQIVADICNELGISGLKNRTCHKLSWGQKRLVSLAGILAMKPEVLIFDEPTASIDEEVIEKIVSHLKVTNETLLIASHDKKFLKDLCTEIYLLKDSQLIAKGI